MLLQEELLPELETVEELGAPELADEPALFVDVDCWS